MGKYMKKFNLEFFDEIFPVFGLSTSQINVNCVLGSNEEIILSKVFVTKAQKRADLFILTFLYSCTRYDGATLLLFVSLIWTSIDLKIKFYTT